MLRTLYKLAKKRQVSTKDFDVGFSKWAHGERLKDASFALHEAKVTLAAIKRDPNYGLPGHGRPNGIYVTDEADKPVYRSQKELLAIWELEVADRSAEVRHLKDADVYLLS